MSDELKPCPFCGCIKVAISDPPYPFFVHCHDCGANGPDQNSRGKAIAAWNTRTPPAQVELVERVARAMQKARDEIGATEQQRIAFAYAEAAMRSALKAQEQQR